MPIPRQTNGRTRDQQSIGAGLPRDAPEAAIREAWEIFEYKAKLDRGEIDEESARAGIADSQQRLKSLLGMD